MAKKNNISKNQEFITRDSFPYSKKIYVNGEIHRSVKVAMREIHVDKNGKNRELVLEETLEKHDQPLYIELKIQDIKELQNAELVISQW